MIPLLNRGGVMKGFVQGADRQQTTLLPECLDDWADESNPVRAVDVFVDALQLGDLGFDGVDPTATGRPAYHPSPMLKLRQVAGARFAYDGATSPAHFRNVTALWISSVAITS